MVRPSGIVRRLACCVEIGGRRGGSAPVSSAWAHGRGCWRARGRARELLVLLEAGGVAVEKCTHKRDDEAQVKPAER